MTRSRSETILVTGGAGYIGSHAVLALLAAGRQVVVVDDLSTGRRVLVPDGVPLVVGDIGDPEIAAAAIRDHNCDAVLHFAGSIVVPESVADPLRYYANNTMVSRSLIETCVACGVGTFVFSSTATVYGAPEVSPIPEDAPTLPVNPYGTSKLMTEWILRDVAAATDLRYAVLRYFNVAGADPLGRSGQAGPHTTHLIRVACELVTGKRDEISIFGDDYDTPDGTCVRDYVHVSDLAEAHVLALDHVGRNRESVVANCGYGRGHSVKEVCAVIEAVAGRPLNIRMAGRRDGDVPTLVADSAKIRKGLGWRPTHDDLLGIIESALNWQRKLDTLGVDEA